MVRVGRMSGPQPAHRDQYKTQTKLLKVRSSYVIRDKQPRVLSSYVVVRWSTAFVGDGRVWTSLIPVLTTVGPCGLGNPLFQAPLPPCKTPCRLGCGTSSPASSSWSVIDPSVLFASLTSPQICLHFILQSTHEHYGRATSLSTLTSHFSTKPTQVDDYNYLPIQPANWTLAADRRRANATFVMFARNKEIDNVIHSVREIEDRFNQYFGYPYVFLSEEPFTEEFKQCVLEPNLPRS